MAGAGMIWIAGEAAAIGAASAAIVCRDSAVAAFARGPPCPRPSYPSPGSFCPLLRLRVKGSAHSETGSHTAVPNGGSLYVFLVLPSISPLLAARARERGPHLGGARRRGEVEGHVAARLE